MQKVRNIKNNKLKWLLLFLIASLFVSPAYASTTSERIDDLQDEMNEMETGLKQEEEQIDSMENQKSDLEGYLGDLNKKLSQLSNELSDLESQLTAKEEEIQVTQQDLEAAKEKEEQQYAAMKKRIQFMYEKSNTTYIELLLSSNSFSDLLNKTNYINELAEYDRNMLEEYQKTKALIKEKEEALLEEKEELNSLKAEVEKTKANVGAMVSETSNKISAYADNIEEAEQRARAYEEQLQSKASTLEELQKQLEEERRAEEEAARTQQFNMGTISTEASNSSDLALMAAIIECEAGGEPYEGKIAVGHVVLNRVRSNKYPNTILEVLYQYKQFTPVLSGRFAIVLARGANSTCVAAAQDVFNGTSNVGDVLHFRTVTPYIDGIVIGGHVFY